MRPGQLVVRYQSPWRRRGLAIVGLLGGLLLLYAIYEWGRFAGGYSKFAEVQRRRELTAQIDALEQENEKLRGDPVQRFAAITSSTGAPWLTRNEARALEEIVARYRALAAQCDGVLAVGTDYAGVSTAGELEFNARVALKER